MLVNLYEPKGYNHEWALIEGNVLQMQKTILNQLNGPIDFNNPIFKQYVEAMEKMHQNLFLGGTNNISVIHKIVDSFIGEIGLNLGNYKQINKRNRYV